MFLQIRRGSPKDDPDGPGCPALFSDHLPQIFLGHGEFDDEVLSPSISETLT